MKRTLLSLAIATIAIGGLAGCAAAGNLAKTVGQGLTDYSSKNTGFIAGAAGAAGSVYTAAGNAVAPAPAESAPAAAGQQDGKKKE